MTEIKLNLEAPATWLHHLRAMHDETGTSSSPLSQLADQIEEQIKPAVEEPTGDVIVFAFGTAYKKPGGNGNWYPFSLGPFYEWPDLIEECRRTGTELPVVYRNEVELTELSTEVLRVGVGDEAAYNNGVSDTVSALVARLLEKRHGTNLMQKRDAFTEAIKIAEALS